MTYTPGHEITDPHIFMTDDVDEPCGVNAVLGGLYPDNVTCWRVITHQDNKTGLTEYALCFVYETKTYAEYLGSGYFDTIEQATAFFAELLKDDPMNIFKNDRLFPRIKGVMLKDKPVILTLSGEVNVVEVKGNDARAELFFTDHKKSATVNRTQLEIIATLYGPDTEEWRGKRIELYGEFGTWFGKETWGIRVSPKVPPAPKKKGYSVDIEESLKIVENAEKAAKERDRLDLELDDEKPPFAQDAGYQD